MKLPLISSVLNYDFRDFYNQKYVLTNSVPDLTDILTWIETECNTSDELLQIIKKIADY